MIGRLRGILLTRQPPQLTLEVQGVGYDIEAPMSMNGALLSRTVTVHAVSYAG